MRAESIRLDAFTENRCALHLYDGNGYKTKGVVTFRKGNFYCYEKMNLTRSRAV
jgi:hypothetical protein